MTADRDALVKRIGFEIHAGTLRERDGGCRTATDHEIALWNILTAPAEAPVAWISAKDLAAFRDSGYTEIATITSVGSLHCTEPLYAAPLPQSAPVSREAVEALRHCITVFRSMADRGAYPEELLPDDIRADGKKLFLGKQGFKFADDAIRSLAAHPAEPAGKGN